MAQAKEALEKGLFLLKNRKRQLTEKWRRATMHAWYGLPTMIFQKGGCDMTMMNCIAYESATKVRLFGAILSIHAQPSVVA